MRASPVETLRKRQACHDLKAQGKSQAQIQAVVNVSRAAVRDWLARPRPTEEEIERTRATTAHPKTDITGQVGFKSRFDPELFARLRAESELQGAATNRVLGCAVQMYLEVMSRARAGGGEPVDVMGWRA
jgi:hypothetical protein